MMQPRVEDIVIALVDAQPAFIETMHGDPEPILVRLEHLLMFADWAGIPLILTAEHPVEVKGVLPERLERVVPKHARRFVKNSFNICGEPEILDHLLALRREQIVVAGAETDVCVLQSVMGLLQNGFHVSLLADCVFSSEPNPRPALERMQLSGAIPCTLKMLYYELKRDIEGSGLPGSWHQRKREFEGRFLPPEKWPPSQTDGFS